VSNLPYMSIARNKVLNKLLILAVFSTLHFTEPSDISYSNFHFDYCVQKLMAIFYCRSILSTVVLYYESGL